MVLIFIFKPWKKRDSSTNIFKPKRTMKEKKKAIKKAYGESYDICQPDEYGWTMRNYSGDNNINKDFSIIKELFGIDYEGLNLEFHPLRGYSDAKFKIRPKSLDGIETNNGWIHIKEEFPPHEEEVYLIYYNQILRGYYSNHYGNFSIDGREYSIKDITHWQPIVLPNLPIY
jgi:hypothetical protein